MNPVSAVYAACQCFSCIFEPLKLNSLQSSTFGIESVLTKLAGEKEYNSLEFLTFSKIK